MKSFFYNCVNDSLRSFFLFAFVQSDTLFSGDKVGNDSVKIRLDCSRTKNLFMPDKPELETERSRQREKDGRRFASECE